MHASLVSVMCQSIYRIIWCIRLRLISSLDALSSLKFWWCTIVKPHLISGRILYNKCILYTRFYGMYQKHIEAVQKAKTYIVIFVVTLKNWRPGFCLANFVFCSKSDAAAYLLSLASGPPWPTAQNKRIYY